MKKLALILGTLAITTAIALAWGGYGMGPWYGTGPGYGIIPGCGMRWLGFGPGYYYQNFQVKQLTEEEAVKLVKDVITKYYKGYEIVKTEKFDMPMGTMYQIETKDAGNNKFVFHVNPFGAVRGPFIAQ